MTADLDLALTEEERVLRDSTRKALEKAAPHRRFTAAAARADESPVDMWPLAQALGWTGLLVPEARGGLGLPLSAAALIAEEAGRGLFSGPFATTAVLAPTLFGTGGAETDDLLSSIAAGEKAISLAHVAEAGTTLSIAEGDPHRITASRDLVEHPGIATDLLLFDLRSRGEGEVELVVALVAAGAAGCRGLYRQPFDVTCPVARFDLDRVEVPPARLRRLVLTDAALDDLLHPFHVVVAAELVGIGRAALERATAYARERQQFGVAIGSFQAIKHRLADAYVQVESAALAVRQAALDGDTGSALAARAIASEAALKATGDCIQVHGGIGFSWECEAHLYLKRARRLVTVLARPDQLRRKVADRLVARVLDAA